MLFHTKQRRTNLINVEMTLKKIFSFASSLLAQKYIEGGVERRPTYQEQKEMEYLMEKMFTNNQGMGDNHEY